MTPALLMTPSPLPAAPGPNYLWSFPPAGGAVWLRVGPVGRWHFPDKANPALTKGLELYMGRGLAINGTAINGTAINAPSLAGPGPWCCWAGVSRNIFVGKTSSLPWVYPPGGWGGTAPVTRLAKLCPVGTAGKSVLGGKSRFSLVTSLLGVGMSPVATSRCHILSLRDAAEPRALDGSSPRSCLSTTPTQERGWKNPSQNASRRAGDGRS